MKKVPVQALAVQDDANAILLGKGLGACQAGNAGDDNWVLNVILLGKSLGACDAGDDNWVLKELAADWAAQKSRGGLGMDGRHDN